MTKDNNILGKFDLSGIPPAPRGIPQIEVTFDVDANGILNVTALEKSSQKSQKITITNDKGRLSKEDIEKMVNDAEKYKAEDEAVAARVSAKNELESYTYSLKNTLSESQGKISDEDKSKLDNEVQETITWLDRNQQASIDEYQDKKKHLESIANPILTKFHQGGSGGASSEPAGNQGGPTVEEVD